MNTFNVPLSFHIFNRPEVTSRVFEVIKAVKPKYLFVTADGPRDTISEDKENCHIVREFIDKNINWDCELYKNYSDINKGSYKSTSEGITWVFNNVEEAIILEDDCLPNLSFFRFCQELLNFYRDDKRISLISGSNFCPNMTQYKYSYFFSKYQHIWGFATWRRTWKLFDLQMKSWEEFRNNNGLRTLLNKKSYRLYWDALFQGMYDGTSKQHWDYKLVLTSFMNHTLAILPTNNLISNIGAGKDAANCKTANKFFNAPSREITFPLCHPKFISPIYEIDEFIEKNHFSGGTNYYLRRIVKDIKNALKNRTN